MLPCKTEGHQFKVRAGALPYRHQHKVMRKEDSYEMCRAKRKEPKVVKRWEKFGPSYVMLFCSRCGETKEVVVRPERAE